MRSLVSVRIVIEILLYQYNYYIISEDWNKYDYYLNIKRIGLLGFNASATASNSQGHQGGEMMMMKSVFWWTREWSGPQRKTLLLIAESVVDSSRVFVLSPDGPVRPGVDDHLCYRRLPSHAQTPAAET